MLYAIFASIFVVRLLPIVPKGLMETVVMKRCPKCGITKPITFFHRSRIRKDGHEPYCMECQAAAKKLRSSTPEGKEANRRYSYKKRYGDPAIYDRLIAAQDGKCALCGCPEGEQRLRVDHDHTTGKVRALLCHKCNQALGFFDDQPWLLRKAAAYLEYHR